MAKVKEKTEWGAARLLNVGDDIQGGKGPDAGAIQDLADRTRYLKSKIGNMEKLLGDLLWRDWN
jgi:hypothetical protein